MNWTLLCQLIVLYFVFSVLGWMMEVTLKYIQYHRFINRGFLIGPYCPIYGSGVVLVTVLVGGLIGMLTGAGFGMMDILLCAVSVLVFMLFTAYDTQKLKYYYAYYGGDASMLHKSSIIGALSLYLDYINIFLYIVRIVGRSRRNN
jgi:uncharacterized membrane protein